MRKLININEAIDKSKKLPNISNGGSQCFDFGDVVLVKYTLPIIYIKDGKRSRFSEEEVMTGINLKSEKGVNTPKHLEIKRVTDGDNDVCYVLQEKCKGQNCEKFSTYGAPIDQVLKELEFVYNIPFSQYKKLISDGCELYEMGYEKKNKNLFYDNETGFWFIDFLDYNKDKSFNAEDSTKMFEALKYIIPNPRQIASRCKFDEKLTAEEQNKLDLLENSIEAKVILSIKDTLPSFERYEKIYLFDKNPKLKRFLMSQGIVKKDLFKLEDEDYIIYNELYEIVINGIVKQIVDDGKSFWYIKENDIRNDSELFGLLNIWKSHKDNKIGISDFQDEYDYESNLKELYTNKALKDIALKLRQLVPNDNIINFLNDMEESFKNDQSIK